MPCMPSGFDVTITNRAHHIEVSDLELLDGYYMPENGEKIIERLLSGPYRSVRFWDRKEMKTEAQKLEEVVAELEEELEMTKMKIQMCRKRKVIIKKDKS